jgi:hypothetical protein
MSPGVHSLLRDLLDSFLFSAYDIGRAERIADPQELPAAYRQVIQSARTDDWASSAWKTPTGVWVVTGRIDLRQSVLTRSRVLWIVWIGPDRVSHRGWWHSYREREWIAGRGTP